MSKKAHNFYQYKGSCFRKSGYTKIHFFSFQICISLGSLEKQNQEDRERIEGKEREKEID